MNRRSTSRSAAPLSDAQLVITWHSALLLLEPPSTALLDQLESVHRASHRLPDEVGGPLRATVVHLERATLEQLQAEYLDTFVESEDPRRKLDLRELLEHAATVDRPLGRSVLMGHRADLELLRTSLQEAESGWAGAVTAVAATLQPSDGWVGAPHDRVDP